MKYLLDTCVVSDTASASPSSGVKAFLRRTDPALVCISSVVIAEVSRGVHLLEPGKRRNALMSFLDKFRSDFVDRTLPFTSEEAVIYGMLSAKGKKMGRPLPVIDGMIAATALRHNLAVVTRNEKDLRPTGVQIVNPWTMPH